MAWYSDVTSHIFLEYARIENNIYHVRQLINCFTPIEFKDRRGSSRDANALKSLYSKLGFYVEAHGDLTRPKLDRLSGNY